MYVSLSQSDMLLHLTLNFIQDIVRVHGSDASRLHVLYRAAPADELLWDDHGVIGMTRWLNRLWALVHNHRFRMTNRVSLEIQEIGNSSFLKRLTSEAIHDV